MQTARRTARYVAYGALNALRVVRVGYVFVSALLRAAGSR